LKLIIQIPAFNEEKTIGVTIADLPSRIEGIDQIEILVVDDGSSDATISAAREAGAHHIVRLLNHRGLSTAFTAGIDAALHLGADIIVNTDADHQYQGIDIPLLVRPILDGSAEVVIGDRNVGASPHMSPLKKLLQRLGSRAVGLASGVSVSDATSGLRAFSREAAFQINVFNPFTYTLETIIQAGIRNLEIRSVPIGTNAPTRPSRLYRGIGSYVRKSAVTMFRVYTLYKPLKTFFSIGFLCLAAGGLLGLRFLFLFWSGHGGGHLQSLLLAAVFLIAGFQTILIALVADLISVNRRLSEEILIRMKKLDGERARRVRPQVKAKPHRGRAPEAAVKVQRPGPAIPEPETQWVWLLDEKVLDERMEGAEIGAEVGSDPKPETAPPPERPGQSRRRRRRRRGGFAENAAARDRKHHVPHGEESTTGPKPEE
jgi:glycosyltransferase involved in cell wall biosynthesis